MPSHGPRSALCANNVSDHHWVQTISPTLHGCNTTALSLSTRKLFRQEWLMLVICPKHSKCNFSQVDFLTPFALMSNYNLQRTCREPCILLAPMKDALSCIQHQQQPDLPVFLHNQHHSHQLLLQYPLQQRQQLQLHKHHLGHSKHCHHLKWLSAEGKAYAIIVMSSMSRATSAPAYSTWKFQTLMTKFQRQKEVNLTLVTFHLSFLFMPSQASAQQIQCKLKWGSEIINSQPYLTQVLLVTSLVNQQLSMSNSASQPARVPLSLWPMAIVSPAVAWRKKSIYALARNISQWIVTPFP